MRCCCYTIALTIFITTANITFAQDLVFKDCTTQNCGNGPNISYPFWIANSQSSYCGYQGYGITCSAQNPMLTILGETYIIKNISYSDHSFVLASASEYEGFCNPPLHNFGLDHTPFHLASINTALVFHYNCSSDPIIIVGTYLVDCANNSIYNSYAHFISENTTLLNLTCQSTVTVPIYVTDTSTWRMTYGDILKMGFLLNWTPSNCSDCENSGGKCGFNGKSSVCYCPDGTHSASCHEGGGMTTKRIAIVVGASLGVLVTIAMAVYLIYRWQNDGNPSSSSTSEAEAVTIGSSRAEADTVGTPRAEADTVSASRPVVDEMAGTSRAGLNVAVAGEDIEIFSNEELEIATENFHEERKLGSGGFSIVYKGQLQDGRNVAIKCLNEKKGKTEQFTNEIKMLASLRHFHIVRLHGCTSPESKTLALVYEYVENGTLADHLHGKLAKPGSPPWSIRLGIAIQIAEALVYLHNLGIIHRDIKTSNILLKNDYTAKLGDLGIARLFPPDVTHVSTACVGTIGYMDPDYFVTRRVTHKSDVYSFGVVLFELISSLRPTDDNRVSDEVSLAMMAREKMEHGLVEQLVDGNIGFANDENIRRTVGRVAELAKACIVYGQDGRRPGMREVLNTLRTIRDSFVY